MAAAPKKARRPIWMKTGLSLIPAQNDNSAEKPPSTSPASKAPAPR